MRFISIFVFARDVTRGAQCFLITGISLIVDGLSVERFFIRFNGEQKKLGGRGD
jgi:hypothetical protein